MMDYEDFKELKEMLEKIGKKDKEREIARSNYMEPEYQESDVDRGAKVLKNRINNVVAQCQYDRLGYVEDVEDDKS